jgi:hypothetical protein
MMEQNEGGDRKQRRRKSNTCEYHKKRKRSCPGKDCPRLKQEHRQQEEEEEGRTREEEHHPSGQDHLPTRTRAVEERATPGSRPHAAPSQQHNKHMLRRSDVAAEQAKKKRASARGTYL